MRTSRLRLITFSLSIAILLTLGFISYHNGIWDRENFPKISIVGRSLEPVIKSGSNVELDSSLQAINTLSRGDYIVFRDTRERKFAKRIVALGGDVLDIKNDYLYVNGAVVTNAGGQSYVLTSPQLRAFIQLHPRLGPDDLFVLGEKFRGTYDSSIFFSINRANVQGRLVF